jgi:hypothetical protein
MLNNLLNKGLANATHLDDRKTHLLTQIGISHAAVMETPQQKYDG